MPVDASGSRHGWATALGQDEADEADSSVWEDADAWADAEPDTYSSDIEKGDDAASVAASGRSHWSSSSQKRGARGTASLVRQSLLRPRLLRQLLEEVVMVVLGDGFSMVICNKKEAATGTIAAQEIRVSAKVRHEARVAQRSVEAERKLVQARREEKLEKREKRRNGGKDMAVKGADRHAKSGSLLEKTSRRCGKSQESKYLAEKGHPDRGDDDLVQSGVMTEPEQEIVAAAVALGGQAGSGCRDANAYGDYKLDLRAVPGHEGTSDGAGSSTRSATASSPSSGRDDFEESRQDDGTKAARPRQGAGEKRSAGRRAAGKMKPVMEREEAIEESSDELLQGWMLVHEVVISFRLPSYIAKHLEESPMHWDKRWVVLYKNELMIFDHPAEAQPLFKVLLDGYFVSDFTQETHWSGPVGVPTRRKSGGESKIPTLELKPNTLSTSGAANGRYLYCRCKDFSNLKMWIGALREAAVLRMVRNTMVPPTVRPWDADVDWSIPDASEAWDSWRDPEEKDPGRPDSMPSSAASIVAGADAAVGEGNGSADGEIEQGQGRAATQSGGGIIMDLMASVVTGLTPRMATPRSSFSSSSAPPSTPGTASDAEVVGGLEKDKRAQAQASPAPMSQRCTSIAHLPSFPVERTFFPALVGAHMEEMSRVLDETRKQVRRVLADLPRDHACYCECLQRG